MPNILPEFNKVLTLEIVNETQKACYSGLASSVVKNKSGIDLAFEGGMRQKCWGRGD